MNLNIKAVVRFMGLLLILIGASMIPSLLVAGIYRETPAFLAFLATIIFSISMGKLLTFIFHHSGKPLKIRDGFLIVTSLWIMAGIIGSLPFIISGSIENPVDAFFETCSGFSTTGASILTNIEAMPKSLLFWRSFTHWLGGMGILIFAIALMPSMGLSGQTIARAEVPGPTLDKVTPKITDTAKILYLIYIFFTAMEIILLLLGGMSVFDALVHTFGTMGTGGFSSYNTSIAYFDSTFIDIVIIVFMILAGTNFNLYYSCLRTGPKSLFKDTEFRYYMFFISIITALISVDLIASNVYDNVGQAVKQSAFQTVSLITTTGYATADYDMWPTFSKILLMLLFFIGGCSSSTGGGVKVIRIVVILKLIHRGIAVRLHPNAIVPVKINNRTIPADTATAILNFAMFYILLTALSTVVVSIDNFSFITGFSAVLSCIGNVGPGFEMVGPTMNYSIFSPGIKVLLSLLMLAGRLELFTFFMIFIPRFWNPNR